jgi:hypothetical protein
MGGLSVSGRVVLVVYLSPARRTDATASTTPNSWAISPYSQGFLSPLLVFLVCSSFFLLFFIVLFYSPFFTAPFTNSISRFLKVTLHFILRLIHNFIEV